MVRALTTLLFALALVVSQPGCGKTTSDTSNTPTPGKQKEGASLTPPPPPPPPPVLPKKQ